MRWLKILGIVAVDFVVMLAILIPLGNSMPPDTATFQALVGQVVGGTVVLISLPFIFKVLFSEDSLYTILDPNSPKNPTDDYVIATSAPVFENTDDVFVVARAETREAAVRELRKLR